MLLCCTTWSLSLAYVLVLYVFLYCFLLCSLANIYFWKTSIWKVNCSNNYLQLFYKLYFRLDCTEAQITFIIIYMICIISPDFWSKTVPLLNIQCRVLGALLMLCSTVWSSANNVHTISQGGCGRNFSSIAVNIEIFSIEYLFEYFLQSRVRVLFFRFGQLVYLSFLLLLLRIIQYHVHWKIIQHFI